MSDVVALCETLDLRCEPGPLGVAFSWFFEHDDSTGAKTRRVDYRIECGSGIAGRGRAWNLVELPGGSPSGPKVTTRRALRRQILEALAEPSRLSKKQLELLECARSGEDRQLPERYDPGPPPFVLPARRWFVPPGLIVPSGSAEHGACRALAAHGLLRLGSVGPSPELPYGQGGYLLTAKGRRTLLQSSPWACLKIISQR